MKSDVGLIRKLYCACITLLILFCLACGGGGGSSESGGSGGDGGKGPVTDVLAAPAGFKVDIGRSQVSLSWDAVEGATVYQVYRDGNLIGTAASPFYLDYNDSALLGQTYNYSVIASDGTISSDPSENIAATMADWTKIVSNDLDVFDMKTSGDSIYVVGKAPFVASSNDYSTTEAYIAKYSLKGELQWEYAYTPEGASHGIWGAKVVVSPDGKSIYVLGQSNRYTTFTPLANYGDVFLAKFDVQGTAPVKQWETAVSNTTYKQPLSLALDSEENAYVVISKNANSSSVSYWFSKYDKAGNQGWAIKQIDWLPWGVQLINQKWDLQLNVYGSGDSEYIYLTGRCQNVQAAVADRFYIDKFQKDGTKASEVYFELPETVNAKASIKFVTTVDAAGNLYVAKSASSSTGSTPTSLTLEKYNSSGAQVWSQTVVSTTDEAERGLGYWQNYARALFIAYRDNALYIGGMTDHGLYGEDFVISAGNKNDIFIMKYDISSGAPARVYTRLTGGAQEDNFAAMIMNSADLQIYGIDKAGAFIGVTDVLDSVNLFKFNPDESVAAYW